MRLTIISITVLAVLVPSMLTAQQAGENINVLPVVLPEDSNGDPIDDWFLKGDGLLQRQVEPTIAASTLNPDHLLAFFVDYRAVDIADDIGLGEDQATIAMLKLTRTLMLASATLSMPSIPYMRTPPIAAAEAWVGMSRSYDGGLTWSGGFLPGAPFDTGTGGGIVTPVDGLQAATDPVLAAGPCGKFYLVFMAFTRGAESKLVVARYRDLNNAGGGDHIVYEGMTVLESGNNATHGYFLDKPDIEVDVFRGASDDICADSVYVSYSTFNGLDKDGKFQSKISFARSFDGGLTFETQKLNPPYNQNQGSALGVDPSNGTIYMIWRHFWAPDAILMVKSTDGGKKWSKPVDVTAAVPMAAFDQPSISYQTAFDAGATSPVNPGFPETAFRSNGFPTAAVTADGTVFAAWQEKVDTSGRPSDTGTPRIVVVHSGDGGANWLDADGAADRRAVDMGWRDTPGDPNLPAPGFGALPQTRLAGPQIQPKLLFSGGQLILAYYESRGRIAGYGTTGEYILPTTPGLETAYVSGYDRLLDFRAALLDPADGSMLSSIQVSRYPIRADADLATEELADVAAVNWPCYPDSGDAVDPPCVRQVNRANAVQSASGTTPFIGDYPDVAPITQFVFDTILGGWRWATLETDVPTRGFHAIFTDNRHLIPPQGPNEWTGYQIYNAPGEALPGNPPGCENGGSRNTDVLTSRVDTSLVLSAPTTFKELDNQRGFPFTVKNGSGDNRWYRLLIVEGGDGASFHRFIPNVDDSEAFGNVEIFAYSSGSFTVYVDSDFPDPVRVKVSEVCPSPDPDNQYACTDSTGSLVFNADSGYDQPPSLDGPDTQLPE
ncbi:MAG: sialidase family protein, partial [Candidatus Sulfomarinibacteraceae bacterium]